MVINIQSGTAVYPSDHKAAMRVPKGGSSCAVCEYLKGPHECGNTNFIKWNDASNKFDLPADEWCCDWFEAADKEVKASVGVVNHDTDPKGWYAFDFDKTIAYYDTDHGMAHTGKPIEGKALTRLRTYIKEGKKVKIFTARARDPIGVKAIEKWCVKNLGRKLEVTNEKDEHMIELYDDKASHVEENTGDIIASGTTEGALKGWDTRGRGKHESDAMVDRYKGGEKPSATYLNHIPMESAVIVHGEKKMHDEFALKDLVNKNLKEPPFPKLPEGFHAAAGIIMQEDGKVWTVTPMNYYGGYVQTFPKGTIEKGETPQEAAIREVHEETGLVAKITGFAGDIQRTASVTRYYFGERVGGTPEDADKETFKVNLIPADKHLPGRLLDVDGYKTADHTLINAHSSEDNQKANLILGPKIGEQKGTNPGGTYKGKDGVERYVKFYKNPDQAYGEHLSNSIYKDLGINAPHSQVFKTDTGVAVANDIIPGKQLNQVGLTKENANEILKGFAADVLTVNWDAVGLQHDNVLVDGKTVTRIDNGGTFLMRAQQGYKPEAGLHGVGELQSLLNPGLNPAYSKVAKEAGIKSYEDIPSFKSQVDRIAKLEKDSGGWDKYVKDHTKGYSEDKQEKIATILSKRSHGLWEAAHHFSMEAAAIWQGVYITGFTSPEEEAVRATLSRIPPELIKLSGVSFVESAPELNAKHGRFVPDDSKVLFNPGNLVLRTKFGGGELAIRHEILTLVHEFGHALYGKLTSEDQKKWLATVGWMEGTKDGQAPPYIETRKGWEPYRSEWTHKAGERFPRYYAEKNPNENFADSFAFFILNKAYKLSNTQRKFFEDYIQEHVKRYTQAVIQSPIHAAIVEGIVIGVDAAIHAGGFYEQPHDSVNPKRKEVRTQHRNEETVESSGHKPAKHQRDAGHTGEGKQIKSEGTSEGALKGWDTRGRGRHPKEKEEHWKNKFEEQELGKSKPKVADEPIKPVNQEWWKPTPKSVSPEKQDGDKKKYKPGEKQKEKVEKFLSGEIKPKGGKISILGGIWSGNAAPAVIYKTMMTGEWHSKADLLEKMPKDVLEKWGKQHAEAIAKGDHKAWSVEDRIESGIRRVQKAGVMFGQWTMEEKGYGTSKQYKLVMGLVHDQAKGQEGITVDLQHKALLAIQKMVSNTGLDTTVSKQAQTDFLESVGIKNVSKLSSCVSDWTGSAQSTGATQLKMVAAEYYGNAWSKEYHNKGLTKDSFDFDGLKKQALAIKALSNEYMKAAGTQYLYRGVHSLPDSIIGPIKEAISQGKAVPVPLNSLSGFSTKISTASNFGGQSSQGIVIRMKVKPEEVWVASGALPHLFGSFKDSEKEYLVGSNSNTRTYVDPKDVWIKDKDFKGEKPDWVVDHLKQKYGDKFDPSKV